MLTDKEVEAVCRAWHTSSATERATIVEKADALRAMAHASPPFNSQHLETWRLGSQWLSKELASTSSVPLNEAAGDESPGIEVAILEMLFSSPRVKAWESAYRVVRAGLADPLIAADQAMHSLFNDLLLGIAETADYPGDTRYLVSDYLVDDDVEKEILSRAGKVNGRKPHVNHAQAAARLPGLWDEMKAKGKSKSDAAPLIAERLGLAESTVRKKLQGM